MLQMNNVLGVVVTDSVDGMKVAMGRDDFDTQESSEDDRGEGVIARQYKRWRLKYRKDGWWGTM